MTVSFSDKHLMALRPHQELLRQGRKLKQWQGFATYAIITYSCLLLAAKWRGDIPRASLLFTQLPKNAYLASTTTQSSEPFSAAMWRGSFSFMSLSFGGHASLSRRIVKILNRNLRHRLTSSERKDRIAANQPTSRLDDRGLGQSNWLFLSFIFFLVSREKRIATD